MVGKRIRVTVGIVSFAVLCLVASAGASFKLAKSADKVGFDPADVAVGDFNRDGRKDLAVANFAATMDPDSDTSITILAGKKGGGFKPVETLDSDQPSGIVADRFGKGKELDLMVSTFTGDAELYEGKKGFGFAAPALTDTDGNGRGVASGDFNGDKRADFAVTLQEDPGLLVVYYAGPGGTTFGNPRTFTGASSGEPVISARINRDKRPDLVTANRATNRLTVLIGKAAGKFKVSSYKVPAAADPAVGDFDQDRNTDVAVISQTGGQLRGLKGGNDPLKSRVTLFAGSKKGKLKKSRSLKLKPFGKTFAGGLFAARVDGDRDPDLAVGVIKGGPAKRGGGVPGVLQVFSGKRGFGFRKPSRLEVQGGVGDMAAIPGRKRDRVAVPIDVAPDKRGIVRILSGR